MKVKFAKGALVFGCLWDVVSRPVATGAPCYAFPIRDHITIQFVIPLVVFEFVFIKKERK